MLFADSAEVSPRSIMLRSILAVGLLAVIATASPIELSDKAKAIIKECREEHGITADGLKTAVENKQLPTSEKGKCFLQCAMEKGGLIQDGKLNVAKAKEINERRLKDKPELKEKANKVIDACAAEVANPGGKCEFASALATCAAKHAKEHGIAPPSFAEHHD